MKKLQKILLAVGITGLLSTASMANATDFTVSTASFTAGSGYGIDANEGSGTLLDVRFSTSVFAPQNFSLDSSVPSFTFQFGTVNFQEPDSHGGINADETDHIGVTASFTFTNPLGITQSVLATGTATTGPTSDSHVDYTLVWDPVDVAFGSGGVFEIAMKSLSFSRLGSQDEYATITLKSDSGAAPVGVAIPEPGTLALLGVGLLGFAGLRRNSAGAKAV